MALEFSEELGLQADLSVEGSILRYLPSLLVQLKIYRACFLPEYRLYITLQAVEECHSIATERRLSLRSKTIFGVSTAVTELKQKEKKSPTSHFWTGYLRRGEAIFVRSGLGTRAGGISQQRSAGRASGTASNLGVNAAGGMQPHIK